MNKAAIYETGDGYSLLRTIDAVKRYFYERDIIGQIVKHVDLYTFETDSDYSFCECDGTLKIHGNALKMSLSAWRPIYFVCKFKNKLIFFINKQEI